MKQSKYFYARISGDYALFTNPSTKGGGEKVSYAVPSRQALEGIVDAIYYKPTIINVVDEVKVIKEIQTETIGTRALLNNMSADLSYVSYLRDVEYLVKFHFIWNEQRTDLIKDRNMNKHEAIMERSIKKGGRRDIFLGTRECVGLVSYLTSDEYKKAESKYDGQTIPFGIMFHSFKYPTDSKGKLKSYYTNTVMKNGIITFKNQSDCEIENELSSYSFKIASPIKSVDSEFDEYNQMIGGE